MVQAFHAVRQTALDFNVVMGTAAYIVAIKRVADVMRDVRVTNGQDRLDGEMYQPRRNTSA
jgi:glutamate dehydrogenase/leucine dehydrogenase